MRLSTGPAVGVAVQPARGDVERELKFMVPGSRVALARRTLQMLCTPDHDHPSAWVWTIYYDTPQLSSLGEKINSEYLKLKVRLRWYSELGHPPAGPVFVEAKRRVGPHRDKIRVEAPCSADDVAGWSLQDARLRTLPLLLRAHGLAIHDRWQPMLLLRYRRDRFVEPVSRARINLDAEIAAVAVNRRFISTFDHSPLGPGILEVKGAAEDLPARLHPLLSVGARKRSFSKFLAIYDHVRLVIP